MRKSFWQSLKQRRRYLASIQKQPTRSQSVHRIHIEVEAAFEVDIEDEEDTTWASEAAGMAQEVALLSD